jgi:hypothetical protein
MTLSLLLLLLSYMQEMSTWLHVIFYIFVDRVGLTFTLGSGSSNNTATFPHAPDITPTSMAYKLLISTSYNADYTITFKTISLAIEITSRNITHINAALYSDYI